MMRALPMRRLILATVSVLLTTGAVAMGAESPPLLKSVIVAASVRKSADGRTFVFRYRVVNDRGNSGDIIRVVLDIARGPGDEILSRDGLVNGPRYTRHSSEDAFQSVPMVPVGIGGPEGWTSSLGFDAQTPPRGLAGWGSMDDPFAIEPGQILDGFQLTTYALPGLREVRVQPAVEPPKG